ncbi:hypothetical protein [Inquilinus limosus]|uniref:hypothetical protein n=1 Tax=Inquilinus limosus TaxID=171674 RepID=UPI00040BCE4A|nr:hypothetical protein [Inquilinus limosus]
MDPQSEDAGDSTRTTFEAEEPTASPTTAAPAGSLGKTGDAIRRTVRDVAGRQKQAGADIIDATSRAMRSAADDLEGQSPAVADVIRDGAERMSNTASALRQRSVDELFESADRFARSRPALFFGAALLAGLTLSRFLKSSAKPIP